MSTRCRPGDLAIIARDDPGYEQNIGRIVEVHGPLRLDKKQGITWLIVPVNRTPYAVMTVKGKKEIIEVHLIDAIEHADRWMIPIKPAQKENLYPEEKLLEALEFVTGTINGNVNDIDSSCWRFLDCF